MSEMLADWAEPCRDAFILAIYGRRNPDDPPKEPEGAIPLQELFEGLDERKQQVVILRFREGLTYAAIGNAIGVTGGRARQICEAILKQCRKEKMRRKNAAEYEAFMKKEEGKSGDVDNK